MNDFYQVDFGQYTLPIIAVYFSPDDYPGRYVARVFDLQQPTSLIIVKDDLDAIRASIPPIFARLDRSAEDVPAIVETWI